MRRKMPKFYSTKTYGNDRGLSCCFRQWRSTHSHCSLLHGYSIGVRVVFECETLDERNWVMDFGGLDKFKRWLEHMFDHTLLIAEDDPYLETFKKLSEVGTLNGPEYSALFDLRIVPAVGCERFSQLAYDKLTEMLEEDRKNGTLLNKTVRVKSLEVFEHGANSAIYEG
jgi:6-pyruvoyltetrahydropterin/6-carboxytetrahydropterin synthase